MLNTIISNEIYLWAPRLKHKHLIRNRNYQLLFDYARKGEVITPC